VTEWRAVPGRQLTRGNLEKRFCIPVMFLWPTGVATSILVTCSIPPWMPGKICETLMAVLQGELLRGTFGAPRGRLAVPPQRKGAEHPSHVLGGTLRGRGSFLVHLGLSQWSRWGLQG